MAGFAFCNTDSSSNFVRLFAARSPFRGQRDKRAVQRRRRSESGHHLFKETSLMAGFAFCSTDSSSNFVRLFAARRSPSQRDKRCSTPAALVRVRHHLFKETSLMAGFAFCSTDSSSNFVRLFAARAHLSASATSALFNACGVSPNPGTTYLKKPA
ncbi:hypothetical protein DMH17_07995 [Raoultella planticola]|nr:hypothetical protein [Raoultella planticola]